ncbi:hypothetical protein Nepgr_013321 [Nepenthes gracilis]|uniref:Nuclear transcription factor Y subunit n=1 Tax=Nepenthes gracilis TaxID=150966 RepID=A0AAD3SH80_NEPGR|nr:hypothetical protein Nepgr_013321 [Nepenthes gracilis]
MPSKSTVVNQAEPNSCTVPTSAVCTEQWWRGSGCDPIASLEIGGYPTGSSSLNGIGASKDDQSEDVPEDHTSKDPQTTVFVQPDHQKLQHGVPTTLIGNGECIEQPPQACAANPYPDLYYGRVMTAFGPQPLVHSQFYGMHQSRMPLPLEMTQEPVYVNAKQYHGIMRRRQSRAKALLEKKLTRGRKPYLHESRHQHALKRERGSGGRFAKKSDVIASSHAAEERGNRDSSASALSLESAGMGQLPLNSASEGYAKAGRGGLFQYHSDFQASACHPHASNSRAEGDLSNQQWGSMSTN